MPTKATGFALLQQPFDKSLVKRVTKKVDGKTKTFPNVDPIHYLDRLNEAFPNEYNLEYSPPIFAGGKAVSVNAKITFYPCTEDERVLAANGAQEINDKENGVEVAYAVKGAQSDALKLALKPTGLGRELYDLGVEESEEEVEEEADEDEKPARSRTRTGSRTRTKPAEDNEDEEEEEAPAARRRSSGSSKGDDWEGKRTKFTVPIGKHKGTAYAKVEQGWLSWYNDNVEREDKNAKVYDCVESEIKYRKANDLWEKATSNKGSSKPTRKRSVDDDDSDF